VTASSWLSAAGIAAGCHDARPGAVARGPAPTSGPGLGFWHRIRGRGRERVQPAERRAEQAELAGRQGTARDERGRHGEPGPGDANRVTRALRDQARRRVAVRGKPAEGGGAALQPGGDRHGATATEVLGQRHVRAVGTDQHGATAQLPELVTDPGVGHRTVAAPHGHRAEPVFAQDSRDHDRVGHGAALPGRRPIA